MNNLYFVFWVILGLYIFLETEAVYEWSKLLHLKFMQYNELETHRKIFGHVKYVDFITSRTDNFFMSLLFCQECLCTWFNIIGFSIFSNYLGGWEKFGITTLGSLIGIALLKFILEILYA